MAAQFHSFQRDPLHEEWVGVEPQIREEEIDETVETDILIIGAGLAGVAAAREATEHGSKVVIFEKCLIPQARSGDFAILDSKIAKKWNREHIDKKQVVADLMHDMGYRVNEAILNAWAENAGQAFDWYLEGYPNLPVLDTTISPVPQGANCWVQPRRYPEPDGYSNEQENFKCYQTTVWIRPTHLRVFKGNYALAEKTGLLKSYFSTPAKKLLKDTDGRVIGAVAQKPDGHFVKALAKKGVILATGDYSSDEKMLQHFCPYVIDAPRLWTSYDRNVQLSNTGDGHRMGVWAGAKMQDSPHAPMGHHMGGALGASGFLLLNRNGERFVNEDCPGQQINNQINIQPGKMAWQIADGNWASYVPHITPNHGSVCYVMDEAFSRRQDVNHKLGTIDCFTSQEILDKAVADGSMLKADSLEELIDKTGMPKEKALKEIARYNQLCAQKHDTDFSKQPKRLFPVLSPPFYATKFLPAVMIVCLGGLESDQYCRCYDAEGNIIKGLYVAGNVQGDRFSGEYPLTVPGLSHSMALTLGRLAGRYASEEK